MAKKKTDEATVLTAIPADEAADITAETVDNEQARPETNASGFYCYIGPNLKKLIQTGTIFRGTRADAYNRAADAIAEEPLVKTLIVSGDALPVARIKVKTTGNALYVNYQKLAGKEGK